MLKWLSHLQVFVAVCLQFPLDIFSLIFLFVLVIDELQVIWENVQDIKKWTESKRQSEAEVGILTDYGKMHLLNNNIHSLENSVVAH